MPIFHLRQALLLPRVWFPEDVKCNLSHSISGPEIKKKKKKTNQKCKGIRVSQKNALFFSFFFFPSSFWKADSMNHCPKVFIKEAFN
jgi:hypothetical protein